MEDTRALVHRIRNDLQLVSSILHAGMDAATTDEARAVLAAMDRRMLAVNLSYSSEDGARVNLGRYLTELSLALGQAPATCPERSLNVLSARRIGMIVAEAIGAANGPAHVTVIEDASNLTITVERENVSGGASWLTGLARDLAMDLIQQLRGDVLDDDPTRLSFRLGVQAEEAR